MMTKSIKMMKIYLNLFKSLENNLFRLKTTKDFVN